MSPARLTIPKATTVRHGVHEGGVWGSVPGSATLSSLGRWCGWSVLTVRGAGSRAGRLGPLPCAPRVGLREPEEVGQRGQDEDYGQGDHDEQRRQGGSC